MDILIVDGKVHEIFENGAPELHPALVVIKGVVQEGIQVGWFYNESTGLFSSDAPLVVSYQDLLNTKKEYIRSLKQERISDGYTHTDGNVFDCDLLSLSNIRGMSADMNNGLYDSVQFKLKDNTFVELNAEEVAEVSKGMSIKIKNIFAREEELIALASTLTYDELNDWTPVQENV